MRWSHIPADAKLAKEKKIEFERLDEGRMKAIIDAMGDGLVLVDMDGKIIAVNPAMEKIGGYPKSEVVGKDAAEIISKVIKPEDLEKAMRALGTALEGKVSSPISFTRVSKDGREIPATFTVSFLKGAEDKPITLIITIKDITELKRVEEELQESEKRYRGVFTGTHDAMWIVKVKEGGEFIYEEVNPEYSNFAGLDRKDVVGRRLMEIYEQETADKISRDYKWVVENKEPLKKEQHLKFVIGEKWHLTTLAPLLDENGNVNRIIGSGKDITELKKSGNLEQAAREWQETFDAITDIVALISPDHEFIKVNKAGCEALGKKQEELIGKKCYEVVHGLSGPIEGCPCKETRRTKKAGSSEITQGGRHYIAAASPILDKNNELVAFAHTVKDITELRRLEEERTKADKKRIAELEKFAKVAVGRELKMVELKERIKELESKLKEITEKE